MYYKRHFPLHSTQLRCASSGQAKARTPAVGLSEGTEMRPVTPEALNRELFGIRGRRLSVTVKRMSILSSTLPRIDVGITPVKSCARAESDLSLRARRKVDWSLLTED